MVDEGINLYFQTVRVFIWSICQCIMSVFNSVLYTLPVKRFRTPTHSRVLFYLFSASWNNSEDIKTMK